MTDRIITKPPGKGHIYTKKRIVIADADEGLRTELAAALKERDALELSGIAADGAQTLGMARVLRPDILVLDLLLPRYDGITVLEQLRGEAHRPQIIVTSAFISSFVAESAVRLAVQQTRFLLLFNIFHISFIEIMFLLRYNDKKLIEREIVL